MEWAGDASESFSIGVIQGPFWLRLHVVPGWKERNLPLDTRSYGIAWLETVALDWGFLLLRSFNDTKGCLFTIHMDSRTAESAMKLRKSRNVHVNAE